MNNIQIISTADGSHSLLNTALNETYHSVHGAVQESLHVFIKNGLDFFCERSTQTPVRILEVGFGTGLNALLTAQRASAINRSIHYTTLEAFPLSSEIWSQLNYADSPEAKDLFLKIHAAAWSKDEVISTNFTLSKREITLQLFEADYSIFDVVYFDAFAPGKQPEM
jgi:tRNA U34 5-methylaminomethyl-2-thiouridine-forming methyltransferase MnmC